MADERRRSSSCGASPSASQALSRTTTSTSTCARGEVHALLGENGAGKSTLMNILYGLYRPDEGEIRSAAASRVAFGSPRAAIERGIGMVHQHFMLIPVMTVAENIVLGDRADARRRLPRRRARPSERVREISRAASGSPSTRTRAVDDITVGQQQRVEILKALYRERRHPRSSTSRRRC